jgi:hypothetical protein
MRICINFQDLNRATLKHEYQMSIANMLVDATARYNIISFMDANARYNQTFIAEEDIHKTSFRCLGDIYLYEWIVIKFGLKMSVPHINMI